jgi:hypothetical protein
VGPFCLRDPEATVHERPGRIEEPGQRLLVAAGTWINRQIALHVLDGGLEHVQSVVKLIELASRDDELGVRQAHLT